MLPGEPLREKDEPSMVYRGRLMYWHLNGGDSRPYEQLDVDERARWTMLASGMERLLAQAPRTDPPPGFTPHTGGPGVIATAMFAR